MSHWRRIQLTRRMPPGPAARTVQATPLLQEMQITLDTHHQQVMQTTPVMHLQQGALQTRLLSEDTHIRKSLPRQERKEEIWYLLRAAVVHIFREIVQLPMLY